jgi:filamentous hemagglutinin family protein
MNRRILLATTFHAGAVMALALPAQAQPAPNARPTGGSVVAGSATISQSPATTTIDQTSQRAAINWQSFNIGSQQTVQFDQPSSSSVVLNRIVGPNPSEIAGRIDANGQVVITNQSGVVFYKGSQVNSAGLMVSAAGIGNANFMAGRMVFDQAAKPNAAVTNAGTITVRQAGLAALVAPQVANSGVITARLGNVVLAGARTATLDLYGDGLMAIDVTGQVVHAPNGATALVTNTGLIRADGGTVQLTAQAADGVVQTLVDAGGKVRADTVGDRTGTVVLAGVGGSVTVAGQLSATGNAPGTTGGSIAAEATGTVRLAPTARIDVSGPAGGGVVAIGTTLARAKGGPSVPATRTASSVLVAKGATIAANATAKGNGGRVAVLSTGNTAFNGAISAKGGPQGGNGGMVETSGNTLQLGSSASVDTSALRGHTGDWLMDPTNWVIANSGGDETPGQVITQLGSSDVTIMADNDITVSSAIDATTDPYATNSLFLEAGRNVAIDANITMNGGFFSATANDSADLGTALADRSSGIGSVTMGPGVAINTSVGNRAIEIDVIASATNTGGGGIFLPGTIALGALTSGAGQIDAGGGTGLTANSAISGGPVTLSSAGAGGVALDAPVTGTRVLLGDSGGGGVTQDAAGAITANSLGIISTGSVALEAANAVITLAGTVSNSGAGFAFRDDDAGLTVGTVNVGNSDREVDVVGITTNDGRIALATTTAGNVTVNTPISSAGGEIDIAVAPYSDFINNTAFPNTNLQTSGSIVSGNGNIAILADTMTFSPASTIEAGSGTLLLGPATLTENVVLGALGGAGTLGLQATDFATMSAGALQVGYRAVNGTASLTGSITIGGTADFAPTFPTVLLVTGGTVTQTQPISFATGGALGVIAGGNVTLGAANAVGTLAGYADNSGSFAFTDSRALTAGTMTVAQLGVGLDANGVAGTAPMLGGAGNPSNPLSGVTAVGGGNVALTTTAGALTLAANVSANGETVTLTSAAAIDQTGGVITAATLTGSSVGGATLEQANAVGTLGPFSDTGAGNATGLDFTDSQALQTAGLVSSTGPLTLTTTNGGLTLGGNVTAIGETVTLASAGPIDQTGGIITAALLTGGSDGGATLNDANAVPTLGPFGDTGTGNATGLSFTDGEALATAGLVSSTGPITLTTTAGGITFGGGVTANGQTVTLNVAGAIDQTNGVITAAILTGNSVGGATLTDANAVGTFGPFSDTGTGNITGLSLTDGQALQTAGLVSSTGPLILTTTQGGLTLSGNVTAAGETVTLNSAETITQGAGVITAGILAGRSVGGATLNQDNAVGTLGPFSDTGTGNATGLSFTDGQALQTAGLVSSTGPITLTTTAGGIAFGGDVTATGQTLTLNSAGAVGQTAGIITAATLTGSSVGGATLDDGNAVGTLGPFTDTGTGNVAGLSFTNAQALQTTGVLSSTGPLALTTTAGALTLGGALMANGQTVTLTSAGPISQQAGIITAATLTGGSVGGATLDNTNAIGTLGPFSDTGAGNATGLSFTDGQALQTAGLVSSTGPLSLTTTTGGITFGGDVTASGQTITLTSAGAIAQTNGVITAGSLTGSSAGNTTLNDANAIGVLGAFTVNGETLVLNNAAPLTIDGPVSAPFLTISAVGQMTLAGNIATTGAPLSQQSGTQPAPGGSTLQVIASTNGQGAKFVQTGTSVLTGGAATTLRIQLPATGGSATFNNLVGPGSHIVLALGNGTATGTMDIGSLLVIGSGGAVTLRGSIDSVTTEAAAALGDINPATNPVYTFNGCEIGVISCTLVGFPGGIQSVLGGLSWFLAGQALPPLLPLPTLSLLVLDNPPLLSGELAPQDVVPPNISFEDY